MYVLILVHLQNYRLANKLLGTDVSICYNIRMHTHTLTHALHTSAALLAGDEAAGQGSQHMLQHTQAGIRLRMRYIRIRIEP